MHFGASRLAIPVDNMQRRMGWPVPTRHRAQNLRVLDHLASVRNSLVTY